MKSRRLFICFLLLIWVTPYLNAGDMLDYEALSRLSATELIKYGDSYYHQNHPDTAIGYYIILAGKYNSNMAKSDIYLCALACRSIANIYYQKESYSQAFKFYMKTLKISEENGFGKLAAESYKNIGNVYAVFKDYQQGIECYEKGLEYAEKYQDTIVEMKILMNLPAICCLDNRISNARQYYERMLKFIGKDKSVEYFSYLNKALIFTAEKHYPNAISYYEKAALCAKKIKLDPVYTGSVCGEMAKLYRKMGQKDSALNYFQIYTNYSEENKLMYMLVEGLQALVKIYSETGNYQQALYYKDRYMAVSDSLFNTNEFNRMKNSQFVYEMDKNYQKIASLTKEGEDKEQKIKTQYWILTGVVTGMLIFFVMLVIVYIEKRKLKSAYKDIYNRNAELLLSEQKNRNQRIEYAGKLVEERERYALLEQKFNEIQLKDDSSIKVVAEEEKKEEQETKLYSTDKLSDEQKERILLAITDIMENTQEFYDCAFSLERLAELIESNSRYVSVVINETYNQNFRTFVSEYRIKEAQLRLMNTAQYGNYTIKAIAESVGYKSPTNFISAFKNMTGITPSIYQKIAKGR